MSDEKLKVYIVTRVDLQMRRGKEIAQACHAMQLLTYSSMYVKDTLRWSDWNQNHGMAKVSVGIDSEASMLELAEHLSSLRVPHSLIEDEGVTEFNGVHQWTALAVGPLTQSEAEELGLKQLKLR